MGQQEEAFRMLDAFASVGATHFDLTHLDIEGQKRGLDVYKRQGRGEGGLPSCAVPQSRTFRTEAQAATQTCSAHLSYRAECPVQHKGFFGNGGCLLFDYRERRLGPW